MEKHIYVEKLNELSELYESTPNTPMTMFHKVLGLVRLNMRYEKIAFNESLTVHPYILVRNIIEDEIINFRANIDALFIESKNNLALSYKPKNMEDKHLELFNQLWKEYTGNHYLQYLQRYLHRIKINHLERIIKDKKCLDLGCGNGVFCFALVQSGAEMAIGVDFGGESIAHAQWLARNMDNGTKCRFVQASVYNLPFSDADFDFIIQNGVFHHLQDINSALKETVRVLKPGGYFWYYTEGSGGIHRELFSKSVELLDDVPTDYMMSILKLMNVSPNKINHLMDALNATYHATTWDDITRLLSTYGFTNFRRLVGGTDTDMDHDRISRDPFGKEKFGEGDLRILCQLQNK